MHGWYYSFIFWTLSLLRESGPCQKKLDSCREKYLSIVLDLVSPGTDSCREKSLNPVFPGTDSCRNKQREESEYFSEPCLSFVEAVP